MNINDYFVEWQIQATPRTYTMTRSASGTWKKGSPTDGTAISGVKYNRSAAERYYSLSWNSDISDVFVSETKAGLTEKDFLVIGGVEHAIDSIVNAGEQDEVYVIGLKVIK